MLTILPTDMDWLIYAGSNDYFQREEFERILIEDSNQYPPIISDISINRSFSEPFDIDVPF
jgi:hypothetical protein